MLKNQKAFTLIELMVTMSVLAVIIGMAVPSFSGIVANNRSASLGEELNSVLNVARSEALKRSNRVSICASSDGISCLAAGKWNKGWLVFVDTALSDTAPTPIIGTIIKYKSDLPDSATVTATSNETDIKFMRFTGSGILAKSNSSDIYPRVFSIKTTGCNGDAARQLSVGLSGMVSSTKLPCN